MDIRSRTDREKRIRNPGPAAPEAEHAPVPESEAPTMSMWPMRSGIPRTNRGYCPPLEPRLALRPSTPGWL